MRNTPVFVLLVGAALISALPLRGQETPPPSTGGTTPLGVRQQRVERMMEDLDRKFQALARGLQETEPDRAKRLKETLDKAKEMLVQKRMGDITRLLDQARLDNASDSQKALLADIRTLLELLLDEKSDRDKIREEFERLSEWKREIENILQQERGEKRESDRLANKEKTLADLQAKLKALEAAIQKQKDVIAATEAARAEGIQGLGKVTEGQAEARQKAETVANQIAKEAGDAKPPYDSKPKGGQGDAGQKGSKGAEGSKEAEGSESSQGSPASEGSPGQPGGRPPEAGEKSLRQAIENQRQAESNLQAGKGKAAQQDEQTALANLEKALAELKKEQSRIASLPPEAFDKMAKKQDDITNQTAQLEKKMEQGGGQGEGQGGGQPGEGGGKSQPGKQKVAQAQKSMQQASGGLRKQDPSDAGRQQGKAIKDLEEALQEIEERLAQLREETQIEKLARLEARFQEMLSIQQRLTVQTLALDKKRTENNGTLARGERNAARAIGEEERRMSPVVNPETKEIAQQIGLAGRAQQALDIIIDDGTSVVFPDVVEQVRDDLITVGNLLADDIRIDQYTLTLQKEIEITLEELIEALQQAQKQKEGAGGGGGGGGGEPPLLPNSAELKLLRSAQLRINRRTAAVEATRPKAGVLEEVMKSELQTVAQRQAEIAEMTVRILERGE